MSYRVHVLYEHGADLNPYGSAYIRLLRPLSHPRIADKIRLSAGIAYDGQPVDAVIVDRLWRPDINFSAAEKLVAEVRSSGRKFIYALDDNFLDFPPDHIDRPGKHKTEIVEFWLKEADAVWVTTPYLQERYRGYNNQIAVIPHALDERLLIRPGLDPDFHPETPGRLTIGYMGTFTHDDDLVMILPALEQLCQRHEGVVLIELVGAISRNETYERLRGLPVRVRRPRPEESNYPLFLLWFTSQISWDIAVAPLRDSPFSRGKSDIKFLDYSAIGAAGVFSRSPAYADSIQSLENGILVEDDPSAWFDALERLILNRKLRREIACNAAENLFAHRVLAVSANRWLEAIESAISAG